MTLYGEPGIALAGRVHQRARSTKDVQEFLSQHSQ